MNAFNIIKVFNLNDFQLILLYLDTQTRSSHFKMFLICLILITVDVLFFFYLPHPLGAIWCPQTTPKHLMQKRQTEA